jgi:glycosyltransferase involved in cell wall biosynthesis
MTPRLTAIVLTYNEERHIERCLGSLAGVADEVVVVDSYSSDTTIERAKRLGASVVSHAWKNYSSQFNWALDNVPIRGKWCLRIDADEYLSPTLRRSLLDVRTSDVDDTTGYFVRRAIVFMGRELRWGGCGNLKMLRLFRTGVGRCEDRWMDEHIVLNRGRSGILEGDIIDENLNNIGWWLDKHNRYATREAIDLLNLTYKSGLETGPMLDGWRSQAGRKRLLKRVLYARLPRGLRALVYFSYRYLFLLGFLDGKAGFAFHFLQGFWYRYVSDIKVGEIESRMTQDRVSAAEAIEIEYGDLGNGKSMNQDQKE